MSNNPLVSIIAINYNSLAMTMDFISSIYTTATENFEIIIIDNHSKERPAAVIHADFPEVKVIELDQNLGFAGGNNVGIEAARGEYLFFVNNDTLFTVGLMDQLISTLKADETIGMVCPKIKFDQPRGLIQYAGSTDMSPWTARNSTFGAKEEDEGQFNFAQETAFPHGAAMMVPRHVINKIGPMPELYFLYYEELDWGAMFKKQGYRIFYNGMAEIFHRESSSVGKNSPFKTYYMNRNRILFVKRNFTKVQRTAFGLYFSLFAFPKGLLQHALKKEWQHCRSLIEAVQWHLKGMKSKSEKFQ
ncbi:glycosyltransferase family 2 protein [Persicobacter psychrovividus]